MDSKKSRASEPATLAKISQPRLRNVYPRERLYAQLDALRDRTVLWLAAPAGSGKTTLIADWLKRSHVASIWYQCDEGDADIVSFFYFLTLAAHPRLQRKNKPLPRLLPESYPALSLFGRNYFRELFGRVEQPLVLVLDNWQEVPLDAPLCELLAVALDEAPIGICLVVISRRAPPPALGRWASSDQMALLQWPELKLTPEETAGLVAIQQSLLENRTVPSATALYEATQGWAAGVTLMLRRDAPIESSCLKPDAASNQTVFDYLSTVVFEQLDSGLQSFLLRTACLENVSASVAVELSGNESAERILNGLVRANVFTVQRPASSTYHYHPLFRGFLRSRAAAAFTRAEQQQLLLLAARSLRRHGDLEGAVHLLLEAEAWCELAQLICDIAPQLSQQGRFKTLSNWIAALPEHTREQHPWLCYWHGECQVATNSQNARVTLEHAYALLLARGDVLGQMLAVAAIIQHYQLSFSIDFRPILPWIDVLEELLSTVPEFPSPNLELRVIVGFLAVLVLGHPHHRRLSWCLQRTEALLSEPVDIPGKTAAVGVLMQHYVAMGDTERMLDLAPLVESLLQRTEPGPRALAYLGYLYAGFRWILGDRCKCHELLDDAAVVARTHGILGSLVQIELGRLHSTDHVQFRDRVASGLQRIQLDPTTTPRHMRGYRLYVQAILATATGDLSSALRCAREANQLAAGWLSSNFITRIACVEALIGSGRLTEATEQLERVRCLVEGLDAPGCEYSCLLLESELAARAGDHPRRVAQLTKAFAIGQRYGYVYSKAGSQLLPIRQLSFALEHGIAPDYCGHLISARAIAPPTNDIDSWPWPVRIQTLGRFQVWVDGAPIRFSIKVQKKPLELLKALIALGGCKVHEDALAEIVWPDADGDAARHALTSAVYRLRRLIGEDAIERQEGLLSLRDGHCYLDVRAFENTLGKLQRACAERQVDDVALLMERAWELYEGKFLVSEPQLGCARVLGEQLQMRLVDRAQHAGQVLLEHGRYEAAEKCYRAALERDPLVEAFYLGLMRSCEARGNQSEALRVFLRCNEVLYSGLGVKPSANVRALAQSLRQSLAGN